MRTVRADFLERRSQQKQACRGRLALARANEEVRRKLIDASIVERRATVDAAYAEKHKTLVERDEEARQQAEEEFRSAHWVASAMFEGGEARTQQDRREVDDRREEARGAVETIRTARSRILSRHGAAARLADGIVAATPAGRARPEGDLDAKLAAARVIQHRLSAHKASGLPEFVWVLGPIAAALACGGPGVFWLGIVMGSAIGGFAATLTLLAFALGLGVKHAIVSRVAVDAAALELALCDVLDEAERPAAEAVESAAAMPPVVDRDMAQRQAREEYARSAREIRETFERRSGVLASRRVDHLALLDNAREDARRWAEVRLARRLNGLFEPFRDDRRRERAGRRGALDRIEAAHREAIATIEAEARKAVEEARDVVREIDENCGRSLIPWDDPDWQSPALPVSAPDALKLGRLVVPAGFDPEGRAQTLALPLYLPMAECANLVVQADAEGGPAVVDFLNAVMMRFLTSIPPSKVRFTILDPVGHGKNFAGFMHLADHDELLVNYKIWSEPDQIQARVVELTEHLEKIFQHDLRGEFRTVQEFNVAAGEVAEPFRILVVPDFPVGFDETAVERLALILERGPQCGIVTLLGVDPTKDLPQGIDRAIVRRRAVALSRRPGGFVYDVPGLRHLPIAVDAPPDSALATRLFRRIGVAANASGRVEVPFEFVAPEADRFWTASCRRALTVAIGKAGATKRQELRLGEGTAQHVLISGRTGSGKSTLLHALITNLALNFNPDEVELYLIDFKKGVEFKTYVDQKLPHARVIAVESEREFGLSVLQRLDGLIHERGEIFRVKGVHDLAGYRGLPGEPAMPRALLIVDEFQELFTENDVIAHKAASFLDRLVRQGRAFGIHVVLGSQSLAGTSALPRTTIGQMGVRVAFQCGEMDSRLILNEDNAAARRLSRPGEAIYNDANGTIEGNQFFQAVWLPDAKREQYLRRVRELASSRPDRPTIVFEGNAGADVATNPALARQIGRETWPEVSEPSLAWLGDPVAIAEPTAAEFRLEWGNHLLVVANDAESALGVLGSTFLSLATRHPPVSTHARPDAARFLILDGSLPDALHPGLLAKLAEATGHPAEVVTPRDVAATLRELALELDRRAEDVNAAWPRLFVFLQDLQRFRALRRSEEAFRYSPRPGQQPSASDDFLTLLRDGPTLGMHVIAWSDGLTNLLRVVDRESLKFFGNRVIFQMGQADSSQLVETPIASRLGPHRAYLSTEGRPELEKFRPYMIPDDDWLSRTRKPAGA